MNNHNSHPSFGAIVLSKNHNSYKPLLGSDDKCGDSIVITLHHADIIDETSGNSIQANEIIAQVEMSYSQFEEAIKSIGTSTVVPVTIRRTEKDGRIVPCEFVSKNTNTKSRNEEIAQMNHIFNSLPRKKRKISKEDVEYLLDELQNPIDKFILLGLHEEIRGKNYCELINLKPEDINKNTVKLCTGRTIKISDRLKHIIEECIEEKYYYINSTNGKSKVRLELINSEYIIKTRDTVSISDREEYLIHFIERKIRNFLD